MGCLGTLVVLALIAAFVIVLIYYPKQTVGCIVAIVVVAVIGVTLIIENNRQESEHYRQRQVAVTAAVAYSPASCSDANPILVTVRNGSSETVNAVELGLQVYRPGYSTDLLQSSFYNDNRIKWDRILPPGQSTALCYPLPQAIRNLPSDPPQTLKYRIGSKYITFAN